MREVEIMTPERKVMMTILPAATLCRSAMICKPKTDMTQYAAMVTDMNRATTR